jgi:hypothetical protein
VYALAARYLEANAYCGFLSRLFERMLFVSVVNLLPALSLSPISEHFPMQRGKLFQDVRHHGLNLDHHLINTRLQSGVTRHVCFETVFNGFPLCESC